MSRAGGSGRARFGAQPQPEPPFSAPCSAQQGRPLPVPRGGRALPGAPGGRGEGSGCRGGSSWEPQPGETPPHIGQHLGVIGGHCLGGLGQGWLCRGAGQRAPGMEPCWRSPPQTRTGLPSRLGGSGPGTSGGMRPPDWPFSLHLTPALPAHCELLPLRLCLLPLCPTLLPAVPGGHPRPGPPALQDSDEGGDPGQRPRYTPYRHTGAAHV